MKLHLARVRKLLYLILLGLIVFGLLPNLAGFNKVADALRRAKVFYVITVLLAEFLFYLTTAIFNWTILILLGHRLSLTEVFGIAWASSFANRLLSMGGVSGLWVRYRFFTRRGITNTLVGIVIAIQNLVGMVGLLIAFIFGLMYHFLHRGFTSRETLASGAVIIGVGILLSKCFYLIAHREKLEKILLFFLERLNYLRAKYKKKLWSSHHLQEKLEQFYQEISLVSRNRHKLIAISGLGFLWLGCDLFALHFSFRALGYSVPWGILILGYTVSNYLATISMLPGGLGVMEASLAAIYASLQVPLSIAITAVLIYRFFSFWLPIPVGGLAYWGLERNYNRREQAEGN